MYKLLNAKDMPSVTKAIVDHTCSYLLRYPKIESFIIGISGGADSALVCALSVLVQQKMKIHYGRQINIVARSLPICTNTREEIERAWNVGEAFSVDFKEVDLSDLFNTLLPSFEYVLSVRGDVNTPRHRVRLGNLKARIRMMYLYDLANAYNGIVMSTDNYTELLLGFWTLHGDVGDFGMIQSLWKTEVFSMLTYLSDVTYDFSSQFSFPARKALEACRDAVPTDGLGISESDLDQFGDVKTYQEVDNIFIDVLNNGYANIIKQGGTIPKVLTMYENTMFKRENPYNISRETLVASV